MRSQVESFQEGVGHVAGVGDGDVLDLVTRLEGCVDLIVHQLVPPGLPLRLYQARVDDQPACVMATVDHGADCGIYLVATLKEHRGRGLARGLLHVALSEARERGRETSSLQSTKFGYPVYARLGYEPICALEMWERRE